jgi:hypothetical protein
MLDDVVHRRANASLSFFAATNVFVTLLTFIPNPVYPHAFINPPAAIGIEALSLFQWWVAGRNYAKYSEGIGANPIKIIKVCCYAWILPASYAAGCSSFTLQTLQSANARSNDWLHVYELSSSPFKLLASGKMPFANTA